MKNFYLLCLTVLFAIGVNADLSPEKKAQIRASVDSMSISELYDQRASLLDEQASLEEEQTGTQSPSSNKSITSRLSEIAAELSQIQKVLVALVGAGIISNITDDGYNDNVPPVITVNGNNPATVELGSTYTDAGATAFDAFHGDTSVSSSSDVDTSVVGSYTVTYSATDLDLSLIHI